MGEIVRIVQTAQKDKIYGGLADGKTCEDIAKRHGVSVSDIQEQIQMGEKVEMEHVNDKLRAREISCDHLWEFPNYYTLLAIMEKVAEKAKDDKLPSGLCPYGYYVSSLFVESTKDDWNYITPEELEKKGLKDFFILDIRKPDAFKKGHLKGAVNIFWLDLLKPENLKRLPQDKKILVYCYVGHTSSQALVLLRMMGFDVVSLKYGMGQSPVEGVPVAGWTNFGFKTVK